MKLHPFKCTTIVLAFVLAATSTLYSQQTTAYDQLVEVNKEWKKQADADPSLKSRHPVLLNEQQLIQFHLMETEKLLRNRSTAQLTLLQKKNREANLNTLHAYWQNGVFPKNTGHPGKRQPYFIDIFNTYCAVGYLMQQSGADKMARDINKTQNYSYLRDIIHHDLINWAINSGLTVDELALIQPGYDCLPTAIVEMHYDNQGPDVNEYIEVYHGPTDWFNFLNRIEFYDHLGNLYKTVQVSAMQSFHIPVWDWSTHTTVQASVYYYNFPANEAFADSGEVRLMRQIIMFGISPIMKSYQYNSTGVNLVYPPSATVIHYPVFENGNGAIGSSLNFCSFVCGSFVPSIISATIASNNSSCLAILPLQLKSFNYSLLNYKVQLNWETHSEINTDRFEIERSSDGANFSRIGSVNASLNSSTSKNYDFMDPFPSTVNYYRIKQIDKDGKSVYSKILNVKFKSGNPLTIQPTIVTDQLRVNIGLEQREIKGFQVYDISGRAILNFTGRSGYNEIDVSNFSAGSYLIRLQTADGKAYSQRFVKQ